MRSLHSWRATRRGQDEGIGLAPWSGKAHLSEVECGSIECSDDEELHDPEPPFAPACAPWSPWPPWPLSGSAPSASAAVVLSSAPSERVPRVRSRVSSFSSSELSLAEKIWPRSSEIEERRAGEVEGGGVQRSTRMT